MQCRGGEWEDAYVRSGCESVPSYRVTDGRNLCVSGVRKQLITGYNINMQARVGRDCWIKTVSEFLFFYFLRRIHNIMPLSSVLFKCILFLLKKKCVYVCVLCV